MSRMLDADHLVRLPTLSGADAVVIGAALETRAQAEEPLPAAVQEARVDLADAHEDLEKAIETRVHVAPTGRPLVVVDQSLDNSWGAGHDLCQAWMRLPLDTAQKAAATRIYEAVFKKGLAFTQLKCPEQWVESQARLDVIAEQRLEQDFVTLGARPILDAIRQFHQEYGDVQGMTATVEENLPGLAESLQAFRGALRYYVLQVVAHARPKDPDSQERARSLLLPLSTWQPRRRANGKDATEPGDDASTPADGDAPASEPATDETAP